MFELSRVERQIGGRTLSIETGRIAKQADGAVIVQYGDTVVLVAAVTAPPRSEDVDFFPLSVDYREKQSAAGDLLNERADPAQRKSLRHGKSTDRSAHCFRRDIFRKYRLWPMSSALTAKMTRIFWL